ncbi:MAG: DUF3301 domain-containing protein [Gammaproteobacteria bacterium]|nr:DUF3301 domain-containing protein [Gammaproteobacteria bacterium]NNJ92403.1 DUF3301 domain-containing protein [Gammaproteobacteria bacterium]
MSTFLIIITLVALAWFWLDSSRARELAVGICRQASEKYGVQLLDESVALKSLGIRWPNEGMRFRRVYSFDFSRDGVERLNGNLALVGISLEYLDFDFSIIDVNQPKQSKAGDVIPINKNYKE